MGWNEEQRQGIKGLTNVDQWKEKNNGWSQEQGQACLSVVRGVKPVGPSWLLRWRTARQWPARRWPARRWPARWRPARWRPARLNEYFKKQRVKFSCNVNFGDRCIHAIFREKCTVYAPFHKLWILNV